MEGLFPAVEEKRQGVLNHNVQRSLMEKDTKGLRYACLYKDCEGLLPNASVYLKGEEILSWHFI